MILNDVSKLTVLFLGGVRIFNELTDLFVSQ